MIRIRVVWFPIYFGGLAIAVPGAVPTSAWTGSKIIVKAPSTPDSDSVAAATGSGLATDRPMPTWAGHPATAQGERGAGRRNGRRRRGERVNLAETSLRLEQTRDAKSYEPGRFS
jgi:hypothetical protein